MNPYHLPRNSQRDDQPDGWLDIMPAIPLARGVPVTRPDNARRAFVVHPCASNGRARAPWCRVYQESEVAVDWRECNALVDLDDHQGFGYALHWATVRCVERGPWPQSWLGDRTHEALLLRWAHGETTDADRVALARVLVGLVTP